VGQPSSQRRGLATKLSELHGASLSARLIILQHTLPCFKRALLGVRDNFELVVRRGV